ncbi:MAG: alanine racemase [Armatimonadetes bacterium]|nr:alanine racemase [Armatimonadota bacterium]
MIHDIWVEVNISALKHNFRQVKSVLTQGVKIMAVVKGNGFGHGYVEPSRAFIEAGADALAVTRLEEALIIRNAGISAPILLFAPIQPENAEVAVQADLEMTVGSLALVDSISRAAVSLSKEAKIHLKIDTGMGRLGIPPSEAASFIKAATAFPNVKTAGIYTHFATAADSNLAASKRQLLAFMSLLDDLKSQGLNYGLAHAANSAALLRMPDAHLDMVRPGTLLYGQYPSANMPRNLDLKPTWQLKARVCEVKDLPKGSPISYGGEFTTKRPTRAAIVPIGYADGFTLAPEGPVYRQSVLKFAAKKFNRQLSMQIRGKKAPVIGRVAMQMTVLDVTDIPNVQVGDEVIVPAMRIPTSALAPRVYVE